MKKDNIIQILHEKEYNVNKSNTLIAPARFELTLLDSESKVLGRYTKGLEL